MPHEVSAKLKAAKKSNSTVPGDIFPKMVNDLSDFIAVPLTKIYNTTRLTHRWPLQWKIEYTTVIPKTNSPTSLAECRNLSCTPLFSKVLEKIMVDQIAEELSLDRIQYGGIRGSGTEHFLMDTWENLLYAMEEKCSSVSMISLDYAKAFNRMCHRKCLDAFKKKGASTQTLGLIGSFLVGRTMCVRHNGETSSTQAIPGGSPQGCVSANLLFCVTIEGLEKEEETPTASLSHSEGENEEDVNLTPPFELNGQEAGTTERRQPVPPRVQDPVGTIVIRQHLDEEMIPQFENARADTSLVEHYLLSLIHI